MNAPELVRHFGMSPHPEGGFYRETYRSAGSIPAEALPSAFSERAPIPPRSFFCCGRATSPGCTASGRMNSGISTSAIRCGWS